MISNPKARLRDVWKDFVLVVAIPLLVVIAVVVVASQFVNPAPPRRITISTSTAEGGYHFFAGEYQKILARDGITLELRTSAGATENLARLSKPDSGVDLGFVQDGLAAASDHPDLVSLGSLYYEPVWVFHRQRRELSRFGELKGLRIATGSEGSGTRTLALELLSASGISDKNARLVPLGADAAAKALSAGQVDVAFFVGAPGVSIIQRLLRDPGVRVMSLSQAEALTRRFPYLHHLVLPEGAIDMVKNVPVRDLDLVAPTATLVARDSLHPALMYLLLQAASEVHGPARLLSRKNEFPSDRDSGLPLAEQAQRYYKSGPPFLIRVLPFWLATFLDRMLILIIPLIAVLMPFSRVVPGLYGWRFRSRVFRWYGELNTLEAQVRSDAGPEARARSLEKLDWIEGEVKRIRLPLAFVQHRYILLEHVDLVRRRLQGEQAPSASVRAETDAPTRVHAR